MKNKLGNNGFFDLRSGLIGAIVMGSIVFYINCNHGLLEGLIAAGKQATYTFFFGGIMMKMVENITIGVRNKTLAIMCATLVTGLITVTLTYLVHSFKGTPEPFWSTVPTAILAPSGFLWWSLKKRKELETIS